MKVNIENYRGIKHAAFEIKPVCAFFGPNNAGKSSIAEVVTACITGAPLALAEVKKGAAMELVNDEARESVCTLETDGTTVKVEYPDCTYNLVGEFIGSSDVAIGVTDVTQMSDAKRSEFFGKLLKTKPTKGHLAEAMYGILSDEEFESLWSELQANGWDTMAKSYAERATQKKGAWAQITGENYGSAKASSFIPEHWSPELDNASESQLRAKMVEAEETVESIASANAIDDNELSRLTELADLIPEMESELDDLKNQANHLSLKIENSLPSTKDFEDAKRQYDLRKSLPEISKKIKGIESKIPAGKKKVEELKSERERINNTLLQRIYSCPECGKNVSFEDGGLVPCPPPLADDEKQALTEQLKAIEEKITRGISWVSEREKEFTELLRRHSESKNANEFDLEEELEAHRDYNIMSRQLQELGNRRAVIASELTKARDALKQRNEIKDSKYTGMDINRAREAASNARKDFEAWTQKQKADKAAKTVLHYAEIADILKPKGLRKKILSEALHTTNNDIKKLGLWDVFIKDDLSFTLNGRKFALCSESERWKISKTIQFYVAMLERAPLIIIDRADILDNKGKNVLFRAIKRYSIKALIMVKANNNSETVDLGKIGMGKSYWVEGGGIRELD